MTADTQPLVSDTTVRVYLRAYRAAFDPDEPMAGTRAALQAVGERFTADARRECAADLRAVMLSNPLLQPAHTDTRATLDALIAVWETGTGEHESRPPSRG